MFVVDTNILVYAADEESPFHKRCYRKLQEWRSQATAWYVTLDILYEFLRVTTHPKVFRHPWTPESAWRFVEALLASPFLGVLIQTERHAEVTTNVIREVADVRGNLWHDAKIAILMREHGIKAIITRDTDFHRFPFLDPVDPTSS